MIAGLRLRWMEALSENANKLAFCTAFYSVCTKRNRGLVEAMTKCSASVRRLNLPKKKRPKQFL